MGPTNNIFKPSKVQKSISLRIYYVLALQTLIYDSQTWIVKAKDESESLR